MDLVPLNSLARQYYEDVKRIEVYYPKQYVRLEMDWDQTAKKYIKEYESEKLIENKIHIFTRFYNSLHNAHHRPLVAKGIIKSIPEQKLNLPIKIFGQGLKLSEARFFVKEFAKENLSSNIEIGDEVISYNGIPIKKYVLLSRDESSGESPEDHINRIASFMHKQSRCMWGKVRCWKEGEKVNIEFKSVKTGAKKNVEFVWTNPKTYSFSPARVSPEFPTTEKGWEYEVVEGPYAENYDALPDPLIGFMGALKKDGEKWLLIKIFQFHDLDFVQKAIKEARRPDYQGVILDFSDNGGGDDSAMTLMGGLFGTSFHLELSSIRLVKEFLDFDVLKEATFGNTKASYLFPFVDKKNMNLMSPLMPFGCLDSTCPMKTQYTDFLDHYDRPAVVSTEPIKKIALITGRGTCSKNDSIAALFRATKVGPIIGTPAVASSGTYYFRKDYVVPIGKKVITVSVTFTPDMSLAGDCEEVEGNPPIPDTLVERTFENRKYYDALTWIKSIETLKSWKTEAKMNVVCSTENAMKKLKNFKLRLGK